MSGQIWQQNTEGGYFWSANLSNYLRTTSQPLMKFRQLCVPHDGVGLHSGDTFYWDIIGDTDTPASTLNERQPIPETGFTIGQSSLTVTEQGISVPFTSKLKLFSKIDCVAAIDQVLRNNCVKYYNAASHAAFNATPLRVAPTSGNSTTSVTLSTNGATAVTNNVAAGTGHIKAMSDLMKERNIPPYVGPDYICIGRPTALRGIKNGMETLKQYTETGIGHIFDGEIGRYEGFRFIEETHVPSGGANDSTTWNAYTGVADAWNNALSDWMFFMGQDTVAEAFVVEEEIRQKLPGDYGRSLGMAWYGIGGFGLSRTAAAQAHVIKWDSAA